MIQREHDGVTYDYVFERGQQWVGPNGTMRWSAVFRVVNPEGTVCWLHELSGADELPSLVDLEALL